MLAHAYEYVCAIAEFRNMSRAAEALFITQPALTKYINRLEKELKVQLFDRSASPIALTAAGHRFIKSARQILAIENKLLSELNLDQTELRGIVTLGLNGEFSSVVLPYILSSLKHRYPNIDLKLVEGDNQFLVNELEKERIDLAIMSLSGPVYGIKEELLHEEPVILAVPIDNPIVQQFDLSINSPVMPYYMEPSMIRDEKFVICSPTTGIGKLTRSLFEQYDIEPEIVMELKKNEAVLRMASIGVGMAFVPVRTALRITPVKPMAYFSVTNPLLMRRRCMYWSSNKQESWSMKLFKEFLKELFQEESAIRVPVCQLIHSAEQKY